MIDIDSIRERLCRTFCSSIGVAAVPCGYAVSTAFEDSSGDRLRFYVIADEDRFHLEDSGDFLATLKASGIDFDVGQRGELLKQVLGEGDAYWDQDTFEIRTEDFAEGELAARMVKFTTALLRARDVGLLTRDLIRSTFREDAIRTFDSLYAGQFVANENQAVDNDFKDFPSDLVLRSKETGQLAAVYFVSNTEKLLEAQLTLDETLRLNRLDVKVVAVLEDLKKVSPRKFQRAQNRGLSMPIFAGDETAAMQRVGEAIGLRIAARS